MDFEGADAYISPFKDRCQGARDPNRYFLAVNIAVAKVKKEFSHGGSSYLDHVNAFDMAEISEMDAGKLNLMRVSSFCGPEGIVWGRDAARAAEGEPMTVLKNDAGADVGVFDGDVLVRAARELFGTVEEPRFPIAPGSLCPAAYSSLCHEGPGILFAAIGVGQSEGNGTTILMEDHGMFDRAHASPEDRRRTAMDSVARSVLRVALNQRIPCRRMHIAYREAVLDDGDVGCALTLAPYFSIARAALPDGGIDALTRMTLQEWSDAH